MKVLRILLAAVVTTTAVAVSHSASTEAVSVSHLNGFQDLKWGDSIATVKAKLSRRYKLFAYNSAGFPLFVGVFGGYRNAYFVPFFKVDRLYQVRVLLNAQDGRNTIAILNDVMDKTSKVYGEMTGFHAGYYESGRTTYSTEEFQKLSPEHVVSLENDVLAGRAWYAAQWWFPDGNFLSTETSRGDAGQGGDLSVAINYISPPTLRAAEASTQKDF